MRPLSSKMPASVDSTLSSKDPSTRPSDSQNTGDGGSDDAPQVDIVRDTPKSPVTWEAINDNKPGWDIGVDEQKAVGKGWEMTDRKDENDENPLPQRDPDGDGDLN
jgi:hypothetical protein